MIDWLLGWLRTRTTLRLRGVADRGGSRARRPHLAAACSPPARRAAAAPVARALGGGTARRRRAHGMSLAALRTALAARAPGVAPVDWRSRRRTSRSAGSLARRCSCRCTSTGAARTSSSRAARATCAATPGRSASPAGACDPEEEHLAAALREAREEIGLDPAQRDVLGPAVRDARPHLGVPLDALGGLRAIPVPLRGGGARGGRDPPRAARVAPGARGTPDRAPARRGGCPWTCTTSPSATRRFWGATARILAELLSHLEDPVKIHPVIMAGGSGTRFWPLSRKDRPKQFLALAGDAPLLAATRGAPAAAREGRSRPTSCAARSTRPRRGGCCRSSRSDNFIVEPCARNTAPCVGLAALHVAARDPQGIMAMLPADHHIAQAGRLPRRARRRARSSRSAGAIATIGIRPSRPETGYGYLKVGPRLAARGAKGKARLQAFKVERFVEKPDVVTAARYLADGGYLWNSGIFVFRADVILEEIRRAMPVLGRAARRDRRRRSGRPPTRGRSRRVFPECPSISIDFGVMEKSDRHRGGARGLRLERRGQLRGAARRARDRRDRERRRGRRDGHRRPEQRRPRDGRAARRGGRHRRRGRGRRRATRCSSAGATGPRTCARRSRSSRAAAATRCCSRARGALPC